MLMVMYGFVQNWRTPKLRVLKGCCWIVSTTTAFIFVGRACTPPWYFMVPGARAPPQEVVDGMANAVEMHHALSTQVLRARATTGYEPNRHRVV